MATTYGTLNQFSTNAGKMGICALSATSFALAYYDASGGVGKVIVASISGTTITYGTPFSLTSATTNDYYNICALDSTHFAVIYNDGSNAAVAVGVVSGTTVTSVGTRVAFSQFSSANSYYGICTLDSTHFVVSYRDSILGLSYVHCGSVSGTTITAGTRVAFGAGANPQKSSTSISAISSTSFFCVYSDGAGTGTAFVSSVSGTTITKGSDSNFAANVGASNSVITTFPLDSTHIGIAYRTNTNTGSSIVGVISGTTISSWGSAVQFSSSGAAVVGAGINSTSFVLSYNNGTPNGANVTGSVSGTTITYGSETLFDSTDSINTSGGPFNDAMALLDTSNFVVIWERATSGNSQAIVGSFGSLANTSNFFF